MNYVSNAIKALILIYVVLFVVYNKETVPITLFPSYTINNITISLLILGALFAGGIVAAMGFLIERMRLKNEMKNIRKILARSEEENHRLRNLPLVQDLDAQNKDKG